MNIIIIAIKIQRKKKERKRKEIYGDWDVSSMDIMSCKLNLLGRKREEKLKGGVKELQAMELTGLLLWRNIN